MAVVRFVMPCEVRDDLEARASQAGCSKSRLMQIAWDETRDRVRSLRQSHPEVQRMRAVGTTLQHAREFAALSGGKWPEGFCEELLYCRDSMIDQLDDTCQRLDVDSDALLLFCYELTRDSL